MSTNSRHRRPPRPPFYASTRPGQCRLCGELVIEGGLPSRKHWHPMCAVRWTIMNQPQATRRFLFKRDHGKCAECHEITPDWQADHIVPLRAATVPEYWQLTNLQSLCVPCHKLKTKADRIIYG